MPDKERKEMDEKKDRSTEGGMEPKKAMKQEDDGKKKEKDTKR